MSIDKVKEIADATGGKIESAGALPDGSGFAVVSMPLPKDHWLYLCNCGHSTEVHKAGKCSACGCLWLTNIPPMRLRMGETDTIDLLVRGARRIRGFKLKRREMADIIWEAGKYAVRNATLNGKDMDFDPDALLQNLVVAFLGYWTENGLSSDAEANPPMENEAGAAEKSK